MKMPRSVNKMSGQDLRAFRLGLGLSQEQFGAELGLKFPQIQISDMELGRRVISDRMQKSIERWMQNVKLKYKLEWQNGT